MRTRLPERLEAARIRTGRLGTTNRGVPGCFLIALDATIRRNKRVTIIASNGLGWEHVSASFPNRCPTWREMCEVKDLFWEPEEPVMQLHPPRSDWVNYHPFCLHLWAPTEGSIPLPPSIMVGPKKSA